MSQKPSVLDLTSPDFDVDAYLSSQLKEKNLDELVKEEEEMVASIKRKPFNYSFEVRRLDSDVHQLVYENYNKFLTATSTVRKIQDEFNLLDSVPFLERNGKGVAQLGSSYKVVKNLQSLFELPSILQTCFDEGNYDDVCTDDIDGVTEAIDLLIKLGKAPEEVQRLLLKSSELSLLNDLKQLQSDPADVLDLVDKGCESFIPNLALLATLHERLFPSSSDCLLEMLRRQLALFHRHCVRVIPFFIRPKDCPIVVRALDRYFRKVSTCKQVIHGLDCSTSTIALIRDVSKHEVSDFSKVYHGRNETSHARDSSVADVKKYRPFLSNSELEQSFVFQVKTLLNMFTKKSLLAHSKIYTAVAETYGSSEAFVCEQFSLVTTNTTERLTGVSELGEALVKGCEGVSQTTTSPGGVRSAVRHTVEEVLECDTMLSRLLGGEVGRKENRHRRPLPQPSSTADSSRDSLWCERIDFNQQLHFNKASIIGAIVMVLLKSFIESIRVQTYGKFAVQQIQGKFRRLSCSFYSSVWLLSPFWFCCLLFIETILLYW
ncbi:hypothetical protein KIN20_023494 [Parelaphostrongylus tenuis]|uniref:Vacuolar protein sorting-associated protein 51 homolog n=1 Tax=Parelaphostrongylus tenuis TaxID=148309 RepID=A0AAD5QW53_PARTN|nr:hypothetical protein KIN20_023494 [Parelaphostrongylus tenuis]